MDTATAALMKSLHTAREALHTATLAYNADDAATVAAYKTAQSLYTSLHLAAFGH